MQSVNMWWSQNVMMPWSDRKTLLKWAVAELHDLNHLCATNGEEDPNHSSDALGLELHKNWYGAYGQHRRMVAIMEHLLTGVDALVTLTTLCLFNPHIGFRFSFLGDWYEWSDEKDHELRKVLDKQRFSC